MKEMPDNRNGYFKKRDRGFTITLNKVLQDRNLSMAAIGLYSKINCHISIPDFEVSKSFIFHSCREGKKAFDSAWKELKNAGYLIQEFRPDKEKRGQFVVTYELLEEPAEDGIHTRYYNIAGEVTKVLHTSYYRDDAGGNMTESAGRDESGNIEDGDTDETDVIITDNESERCGQKTSDENGFDHIPEKGDMVKSRAENDHVPEKGDMVRQGKPTDRYPPEGITLKGVHINNTNKNNTCFMNVSSSSEYADLLKSDEPKNSGHNGEYTFGDFLQTVPDISVKLRKFIREAVFNAAPETLYKVGREKKVTKRQMLEHISLLESGQIKRIDEMLCDGRIYSVNGLQTYLYNALYLGTAADKGRPAAEKPSSGRTYTREEFCDIERRLLNKKTDKKNIAVPDG